jgi:hypothetical protein
MNVEVVQVSDHFQVLRTLRLTSASTEVRHLGPGGKQGHPVLEISTSMNILEVDPVVEDGIIPDTLWSAVKIEWSGCDGATKEYTQEFGRILQFAGEEVERFEAHAREQDAAWKAMAIQP